MGVGMSFVFEIFRFVNDENAQLSPKRLALRHRRPVSEALAAWKHLTESDADPARAAMWATDASARQAPPVLIARASLVVFHMPIGFRNQQPFLE